ncbi:hypothetical protein GCM10010967_15180 [Dyadobacter beijingensis]|uniref:Signal transduction histidine kinase internal region domain-containing protein n=2 Tax=Dyadobacter beijingensis TaxID=365489 RepID=A0ABQ2HLY6_9BACT|nr:hypothetical protein GCM10010967_15180 [Dyadobacter beijingensis]
MMSFDLKNFWLNNRYLNIAKHLTFCWLYWIYILSDFSVTLGRTGDEEWNRILSNCIFALIILSIYSLIYALQKSLPDKFYIFVFVAVFIYFLNSYVIYYSFKFIASTPNPSKFVSFGWQRMKSEAFWRIPFNRFMDLYIWALTGNYIVIPIAIIGISNTFSYFNRILKLQRNNLSLELDFLRSQLNPHFLFNSLNNIYSMVEETNELAGNTILKLADLMRYSLYESSSENVLLSREILFLKDYIELEKIRHTPDTLISFKAEGNFDGHRIPPFLLIPFVENAFKHGLNTVGKKWVEIVVRLVDGKLAFQVRNSKPSMQTEPLQKGGIGLVNLKKRLDIYYPNRYELKVNNSAAEYDVFLHISLK